MKNIILLLLLSICFWSCHVQKHIEKSETSTERQVKTDSSVVKKELTNVTETKKDNTVTVTREHITNIFKQPQPNDTAKAPILVQQTIDREITENKDVSEQKDVSVNRSDSTNVNNQVSEKSKSKAV